MKRLLLLFVVLGLVLAGQAWAEEKPFELEVSVGGSLNDYDDSPNRAAEYKSQVDMDSSWYLGGKFRLDVNDFILNLEGKYIEKEDQEYNGSLDFRRLFSVKSSFSRFWHRLDRDLMENLQATATEYRGGTFDSPQTAALFPDMRDVDGDGIFEGASAAVWHDSYETHQKYGIRHSFWTNEAVLRLPALPGIQIGFKHRFEERRGWDQARTLSKCSSCHVAAYSRHIKEYTNDYIPYIEARLGQWTLKYSFMYRSFNSGDDVPRHVYLNAQGPAPFGTVNPAASGFPGPGALNYEFGDDNIGDEYPFARTPDSEKWQHLVKAKWDISAFQSLNLGFVYSEAQNENSDEAEGGVGNLYGDFGKELEVDYTAFTGNWHWRFRKDMTLTVKAKYHNMDGDDVYVDLPPYGFPIVDENGNDATNFDFERKSAYDEDEFILAADLSWRYSREWLFRFGYELEYTDRDNAEEHHVTEDTTEHLFKLGATWKPRHGLKVKADYNFLYVNDPYAYKHAACPEEAIATTVGGSDFTPVPNLSDSWYSLVVYGRRQAETSNQPEYAHDLGLKVDYILNAQASVNAYLKYHYAKNNNTDGYDWEQDTFMGGINLNFIPNEKIGINIGYNYFWDQYTSMLCSAVYHG